MSRAVTTDITLPRPNIIKLVDDGTKAQLAIQLQSDVDTENIKHVFSEHSNITDLKIINRK